MPNKEYRKEQIYVSIPISLRMEEMAAKIPALFDELYHILEEKGITNCNTGFVRYLIIDMDALLDIEVAVPLAYIIAEDHRYRIGVLPAGEYAILRHKGPYEGLIEANAALQSWAQDEHLLFDTWHTAAGEAWACRLELYSIGPPVEPDSNKWITEVCYKLTDLSADT